MSREPTEGWYEAQHPQNAAFLRSLFDKLHPAHAELMDVTERQNEHRSLAAAERSRMLGFDPRFSRAAAELSEREIARHEAAVKRLAPIIERARQRHQVLAAVTHECVTWLDRHGGGRVRLLSSVAVERQAGENYHDAVARERRSIATATDRINEVEGAGKCPREVAEQLTARVAEMCEAGRPDLSYLLRGGDGRIEWPEINRAQYDPGVAGRFSVLVPDVPAMLAWLLGDRFLKALLEDLASEAAAQEGEVFTDAERARLLDELQSEIFEAGRREEALVRMAEAEGIEILRRRDADPRAVLGVEAGDASPGDLNGNVERVPE